MTDLTLPALAQRYRVERELGRGGMANVYLAEDLKHGRRVAIKVLRPEVAAAIGEARFLREIEIAARLSHPHVVGLFDSGVADGQFYYVMPYIEGETLRERIDRERQLPLDDALRIAREIASALGHAHRHGLVHRDIKPENVLLSDGIAMVTDFGIARSLAAGQGQGHTTVGSIIGTPAYMAPEQVAGGDIDARADIYSLACVVFEALAGVPPFNGPVESLLNQHLSVTPRPVSDIRLGAPAGVTAVIARALAKAPADRYLSAARFAEALATATAGGVTPVPVAGAGSATPHNLPSERTHFIGRERELAECARLFADTRLLTLTGIGGCGKTRLALQLARAQLEPHPDGVWFADLAPLTEASQTVEAVAAAAGIKEVAGEEMGETLRKHVVGKRLLLVLDNCEHLLTACAQVADMLLAAGGELRILATSREGLGVEGERLYGLRSLAVPSEAGAQSTEDIRAAEAVRLFIDRARAVLPGFEVTAQNAREVAEICRRLDGIPLAIELAAARVKILSVDQIRERLGDRFRLLTGGSRTSLPRHQTLRAAIQWSYDQLSDDERRLLRLLSVFAGGWTLASATRVAGEQADEFEVMDLLARLVDKSLVMVTRKADEPRYDLLETVRQYAQEHLTEAGEADIARRRHLEYCLDLADRAYAERFVRDQHWADVLEAEHDNFHAALLLARGADAELYLRLTGALSWFWQARSHLLEGREHLRAALADTAADPPRPARARALWGLAHTMAWLGDGAGALPLMQDALKIWRVLGDLHEVALALEGIGWAQFLGGDDETAYATFEECLRLQRDRGDPVLVNRTMEAVAQVLVALNRVGEARPMANAIIAFSQPRGDRRSLHLGWHYLADCALIEGQCRESLGLYQQSLRQAQAIGDRLEISFEVQGVAMSLAGLGDAEQALRLASAAKAEWEKIGVDLHMRFWDELLERYLGAARQALGEEVAKREWQEGMGIPFERAIAVALETKALP